MVSDFPFCLLTGLCSVCRKTFQDSRCVQSRIPSAIQRRGLRLIRRSYLSLLSRRKHSSRLARSVRPFGIIDMPTMASADFCHRRSPAAWQTSPGNALLLSRLCPPHLLPCFPYRYWTLSLIAPLSNMAASMRFLFVEPAFCVQLPSDSTSRWTPLLFG